MSTIRGVKDRRFKFVQLLNSMFEDPDLSLKAKGLIGFCLTKPEGWGFKVSHLEAVLKEGVTSIYSTLDECISKGYAIRYQHRKSDGKFDAWETIISDSRHEIELIKKDLENNPNFQKSFTLSGFPVAESAGAESVKAESPSESPGENDAIYSNTEYSNTDCIVCADSPLVGADPLLEVEKIEKVDFSGKSFFVCKSEIFTLATQQRLNWTFEDIHVAWEVLVSYTNPIRNWWEFFKGTVENQKKIRAIKKLKLENEPCKKTQKQETSKDWQPTSENLASIRATWTRGLPGWNSKTHCFND